MTRQIFYGLYKAETPLQHSSDESMETTTLFRSNEIILENGELFKNYNVSAASFRHVIRQNATNKMLEIIGLKPEELPEVSHVILFSGGPRLNKKKVEHSVLGDIHIKFSNFINENIPIIELLGSTCFFSMLPAWGSALTVTSLNVLQPELKEFSIEKTIMETFKIHTNELCKEVSEFQFNTKVDGRVRFDGEAPEGECETVRNIFDVQYLKKGTLFGNCISIVEREDGLLSSCFSSAIKEWQKTGRYIAGKKSVGAGMLSSRFSPSLPSEEPYEKFIKENKTKIKDILQDTAIWKDAKRYQSY
jgi:hypothetical protein